MKPKLWLIGHCIYIIMSAIVGRAMVDVDM
jgi:hypothetical protein